MRAFPLIVCLVCFIFATTAKAQNIFAEPPDSVDTERYYLFYIHDNFVSSEYPEPTHPEYGKYEYLEIVNRLATEGFTVISYPREKEEHPYVFAQNTAAQIQRLIDAGVPQSHISIVGAGSGGAITVLVCTKLRQPDVNVVLLGSCTEPFITFWQQHNELLCGNVLSMFRKGSASMTACRPYLEYCSSRGVGMYREIALESTASEAFFFRPTLDWLMPVILWSSAKHDLVHE